MVDFRNCFGERVDTATERIIFPQDILREKGNAEDTQMEFCDNTVINSKYTVLTFVPLNLWEQLHRPINLYFLVVGLVQFISIVSPVSPFSMLVPLWIGFGITAAKEAYDDFLRHREDTRDNSRKYRRVVGAPNIQGNYIPQLDEQDNDLAIGMESLRRHLRSVQSRDIRVGDIVALRDGEEVPCDMVALLSCHLRAGGGESNEELFGTAFVSTENLDGEADAKQKHCVLGGLFQAPDVILTSADGSLAAAVTTATFLVPGSGGSLGGTPTEYFLQYCAGAAEYLSGVKADSVMRTAVVRCEPPNKEVNHFHGSLAYTDAAGASHQIVLDEGCLLVGGSKVRSTAAVFGIAVYTGKQTKGNLSKKGVMVKWSQFDRLTTLFCIAVFILQFVLVLACGIMAFLVTEPAKKSLWYLGYYFQLQEGGGYGIPKSMADNIVNTWEYYVIVLPVRMFIMLTVLLPVSFKVMLEVSKYYISRSVEWDLGMCHDQVRGGTTRCIVPVAKNSSLAEDLGQIAYVMTDKTGTLTQNEMQLRFLEVFQPPVDLARSSCTEESRLVFSLHPRTDGPVATIQHPFQHLSRIANGSLSTDSPVTPISLSAQRMLEVLTLCNAVERPAPASRSATTPTPSDNTLGGSDGAVQYAGWESPSPDEAALVYGAHLCGATLHDRNRSSAIVRFPSALGAGSQGHFPPAGFAEVGYQFVGSVPFSSDRGRMTVVVRVLGKAGAEETGCSTNPEGGGGECYVLVKGADERVLPCCCPESIPHHIQSSLNEYSIQGLRTLIFAWRPITSQDADAWALRYKAAASLPNATQRKQEVAACSEELERDLFVVGMSAVEDRLQDGVPETISLLRGANVKVWMLTGDKIETAKQIGLSCRMLRPSDHLLDMTYLPVKGDGHAVGCEVVATKLREVVREMRRIGQVGVPPPDSFASSASVEARTVRASSTAASMISGDATPLLDEEAGEGMGTVQSRAHFFSSAVASLRHFFSISSNSWAVLREMWEPNAVVKTYIAGRLAQMIENEHSAKGGDGGVTFGMLPDQCSPGPSTHVQFDDQNHYSPNESHHECSTRGSDSARARGDRSVEGPRLSLVINGGSLSVLQRDEELMRRFKPILLSAVTVICCRVTPDQKAFIVRLARDEGHVTLAIGDGGNDVAMIQEAHVGVGITGYEGRQAALAADFAVGQFRFLSRLMLVHGHQAFQRSAAIVQYSFYKCTFIAIMQVLYNLFTMMSGITFWSSFALTVYNSAVTIPMTFCFVMGTPALPRKHFLTAPYLYTVSQQGRYMNGMTFLFTAVRGIVQSCAIFFLGKHLLLDGDIIIDKGRTLDTGVAYVPFYLACLIVQVLIIICQTYAMTWVHWICVSPFFGVGSFIVTWMVYMEMVPVVEGEEKSAFYFIISHGVVPLNVMLMAAVGFLFFYGIHNAFVSRYFPSLLQLFRQIAVREDAAEKSRKREHIEHAKRRDPSAETLVGGSLSSSAGHHGRQPDEVLPVLLALESECSDSLQGNDWESFIRSVKPRI